MHLTDLRIRDFRCLEHVDFAPAPGINLIVGDNASGKSSLLEAIYFLGRARSFRRTPSARLIRRGATELSVYGRARSETAVKTGLGIVHGGNRTRIKIGNDDGASLYDLVTALPVQVIDPNLHRLLEEGPSVRRRYLDWGVFHVEHSFYPAWRRYRRALLQRNRSLRAGQPSSAVVAWDAELVRAGKEVDACRRSYIHSLELIIPGMAEAILGEENLTFDYHPGWQRNSEFADVLVHGLESDRRAGFTQAGPHRADLKIRVGGLQARDWVSRGQQKVLTAALLAAQAAVLSERTDVRPILLIDDIAAELGASYRAALVRVIESLGVQCFLTFLDAGLIPEAISGARMFHVEHGRVASGD